MSERKPLHFEDGTPIVCEWTPNGPDKSTIWACGAPAVYDDAPNDAWYCADHAPHRIQVRDEDPRGGFHVICRCGFGRWADTRADADRLGAEHLDREAERALDAWQLVWHVMSRRSTP